MKRLICPLHGRVVAAANSGKLLGKCDLCAAEAANAQALLEATLFDSSDLLEAVAP